MVGYSDALRYVQVTPLHGYDRVELEEVDNRHRSGKVLRESERARER